MYYVYVLRSGRDNLLYTGSTGDLERRLQEHKKGQVVSTARRRPLALIRIERYVTKNEARTRERFLKSGQGRKLLKRMLARGER